MTGIYVHKNDTWNLIASPQVNVDGVWFSCKAVYVMAGDAWHKVYQHTAEIIPFPTRRYEGELQDVCISAA